MINRILNDWSIILITLKKRKREYLSKSLWITLEINSKKARIIRILLQVTKQLL